MMMTQRTLRDLFELFALEQLHVAHPRWWTKVIHNRIRFIESLRREHVLVRDAFVLISRRRPVAMKPDVMFSRDFSQFLIIRHCRSSSFTNCLLRPVRARWPRTAL